MQARVDAAIATLSAGWGSATAARVSTTATLPPGTEISLPPCRNRLDRPLAGNLTRTPQFLAIFVV
jgi:hypothetical protein